MSLLDSSDTVTENFNEKHWFGSDKLQSAPFCAQLTRGRLLAALGIAYVVLITLLFAQCTLRFEGPSSFLRDKFGHTFWEQQLVKNITNSSHFDQIKRDDIRIDEDCYDRKPLEGLNVTTLKRSDSSVYRVVSAKDTNPCSNKFVNVQKDDPSDLPVRRLPQCLIIGVAKCGTSTLLYFLDLHPDIVAVTEKRFFKDDKKYHELGLKWYLQQMRASRSGQITIEKTPSYIFYPKAARRIREMNSSIKLIVIVRDPVDRSMSSLLLRREAIKVMRRKYGNITGRTAEESHSFEQLAINPETGRVNERYSSIYESLYYVHLLPWLRYFPLQQFHFVSDENLVANPVEELRKVEKFLELQHRLTSDLFYFNKTRGFYCMCIDPRSFIDARPNLNKARPTRRKGQCMSSNKGRPHPNVDPKVRRKLQDFFRPYNQRFYEIVGVDFGW